MERVWRKQYANPAEATQDIADYIVNFYNVQHPNSTAGAPNGQSRLKVAAGGTASPLDSLAFGG